VNLAISSGPPKIGQINVTMNDVVSFSFSATSGVRYRVEYKNDLNDTQWTALGADIVAGSNTIPASDDLSGVTNRFYRVLQLN